MIDATHLIESTREPFAIAGLCSMQHIDMVNEDGEMEFCVVVAPEPCSRGIALRYTRIPDHRDPLEIVAGVVQLAMERGLV